MLQDKLRVWKDRTFEESLLNVEHHRWNLAFYLFSPLGVKNTGMKAEFLNEDEEQLAQKLTRMWVSFGKNGYPKEVLRKLGMPRWKRLTDRNVLDYYSLQAEDSSMQSDYREMVCVYKSVHPFFSH